MYIGDLYSYFLEKIKYWIQKKIYNANLFVQEKIECQKKNEILEKMHFYGSPLVFMEGYCIHGAQYMHFGDDCVFGKNAWVECIDLWNNKSYTPILCIGNGFRMQNNCHLGCVYKIEIGDNVLLGSKVYITDHYHGAISRESLIQPPAQRELMGKPVKIGNNVWIGDNVCIMPGITLGDNVIVGANAVVTHSFPDNAVVAGCPARLLRVL